MSSTRIILAGAIVFLLSASQLAVAGRGGFGGGYRGGMGGMGMAGRSGMNGMPPEMSSRAPNGGMGMAGRSGMNGMPPGMSSRAPNGGMGMAGRRCLRKHGHEHGEPPLRRRCHLRRESLRLVPRRLERQLRRRGRLRHARLRLRHGRLWLGYGMPGYGYGMGGYGLYGLSPWAYGSQIYNMGYAGYANPYNNGATIASARFNEGGPGTGATIASARFNEGGSGTSSSQAAPYDYSQPINSPPTSPQQSATQEAQAAFDQSRAAFKNGDYAQARSLCDKALQKLPDDPKIHEFRGTCPVRAQAVRRIGGDTLYRSLGRTRLGLDDDGRALPEHRGLHGPASRPGIVQPRQSWVGRGPLRARLPVHGAGA